MKLIIMKKLLLSGALAFYVYKQTHPTPEPLIYNQSFSRTRAQNLESMKKETYDIMIIGGGATGAGVALEAASRGLKTCLVEKGDFAGQTSSKSTKLLHGGVRYLEKVVKLENPKDNLFLVVEGLRERSVVLNSAQHITSWVSLAIPCKSYFDLAFFYCGQIVYHLLALVQFLPGPSIPWPWVTFNKEILPSLKQNVGSVIYTDGQMNDCRLCVEVLTTASRECYMQHFEPCHIANYAELISLEWIDSRIQRALVKDRETGEVFWVKSKVFMNCTGPFSDRVRAMAGLKSPRIVPGKGSHLILPGSYCPQGIGMLIPKTQDGRVLFLVPWENHTILGTTDETGEISEKSKITEKEKDFLIKELGSYLDVSEEVIRKDVLGSFSGERPLVTGIGDSTKDLLRTHEVEIHGNGLVSVLGGKWTTFRAMGEDAVSKAAHYFRLQTKSSSVTTRILYKSNHPLSKTSKDLATEYKIPEETADYLIKHYGTFSETVIKLGIKPLIPGYPFIEGEIRYAVREEYALHPVDIVARRLRLALINYKLAQEIVPKVAGLMAEELNWNQERLKLETGSSLKEIEIYLSE
jgi:glycerol-3-phosphate dehydrogenase